MNKDINERVISQTDNLIDSLVQISKDMKFETVSYTHLVQLKREIVRFNSFIDVETKKFETLVEEKNDKNL